MSVSSDLLKVFAFIDENHNTYIKRLSDAVAIRSVSAWPQHRPECQEMIDWTEERLKKLGVEVQQYEIGKQTLADGKILKLPNVILADLGDDPKKHTILIYGHLDVQPASIEDGWDSDPFILSHVDDKLYGRGATDDKGPVCAWLHAIEAYQQLGLDVPVNIKFVFEAMEESGSLGLDALLKSKKNFLANCDFVCISDNYWLGNERPCLTYGLRGICLFSIEIEGTSKDLHSGVFGGTVYEPMNDLIHILGNLVDCNGNILVPGIYDDVEPMTEKEKESYKNINFNIDKFRAEVGANELLHTKKEKLLQHRWRFPTLSIHGIEGAFSESGQKTVIPRKVIGKFSIRVVPNQNPETVGNLVVQYVNELHQKWGSPNKMRCQLNSGTPAWIDDPNSDHYKAAIEATKIVYQQIPDMIREGGSIPVTLTFQELTGKSVLLLPIGTGDDGAHSQNEKINVRNYIEGTKLLAAYLHEVSKIPK